MSTKDPAKPRQTVEIEYGQAEGSNLSSAEDYAKRAVRRAVPALPLPLPLPLYLRIPGSAARVPTQPGLPPLPRLDCAPRAARDALSAPCAWQFQEAIGASVALSAAVDLLPKKK